jgi:hypothetical protein
MDFPLQMRIFDYRLHLQEAMRIPKGLGRMSQILEKKHHKKNRDKEEDREERIQKGA